MDIILAILSILIFILALSIPVLMIIAYWKIFSKAGEPGWASLIPLYSGYVQYRFTWDVRYYFITLGCFALIFSTVWIYPLNTLLTPLYIIAILVIEIMNIISLHKLSRAFGHDIGFTLGLIFLEPIFIMILGFGSSEYEGIQ